MDWQGESEEFILLTHLSSSDSQDRLHWPLLLLTVCVYDSLPALLSQTVYTEEVHVLREEDRRPNPDSRSRNDNRSSSQRAVAASLIRRSFKQTWRWFLAVKWVPCNTKQLSITHTWWQWCLILIWCKWIQRLFNGDAVISTSRDSFIFSKSTVAAKTMPTEGGFLVSNRKHLR